MKKITIIGGDNRLKIAMDYLRKEGYYVDSVGLYDNDEDDYSKSDVLLLPVPTTKDKKTIFSNVSNKTILLSDIEENASNNQLILCCNYAFKTKRFIDYGLYDSYSLLNAVPTAEGAIKIAIEETKFTIWQSNILIIGFGRVGKVLSERIKALGANLTVSARNQTDFAMLDTLNIKHINSEKLNEISLDYDIIFNTVDVKLIENSTLKHIKTPLIIDLSSKGGFDLPFALSKGIKAIKAPGLPGITAPLTAGKILADTVTQIIN